RSGGAHLSDPDTDWRGDVMRRWAGGGTGGVIGARFGTVLLASGLGRSRGGWRQGLADVVRGHTELPWRAMWLTYALLCLVLAIVVALASGYHVFGTDRTGNDVLWQALKSVRTALVIGSLTTLAMLP